MEEDIYVQIGLKRVSITGVANEFTIKYIDKYLGEIEHTFIRRLSLFSCLHRAVTLENAEEFLKVCKELILNKEKQYEPTSNSK